jgi:DNA polymerase III subunit gamma/tau
MENFIVSARKYRPATFDMVVGQDSITNTLKSAIKGKRLAQSYLFCGPRGVGKTTCARIFAKTINCFNLGENGEACDKCESCISFNTLRSFNIHELDAASNNKVDDIRLLTDQVRIPPQVGRYSIYIIDEVHMLSSSAFNAFLKTLEEPPSHAIFILATTEKHKIIPTILSRCQIFDFNRIRVEDIVARLSYVAGNESVKAEEEALHVIAQKADGALRDALSIFDQIVSFSGKSITYKDVIENLNVLDYEYYFRTIDAALEGNVSKILLTFNEVLENGFDGHNFVAGLNSHLRDLLVSKDKVTIKLLEATQSVKQRYMQQAEKSPVDFLFRALETGSGCDLSYKNSKNQRLHVELALIKLCTLNSGSIPESEKKKPEPVKLTLKDQPSPESLKKDLAAETSAKQASRTFVAEPAEPKTETASGNKKESRSLSIRDIISEETTAYKKEDQATEPASDGPDLHAEGKKLSADEFHGSWSEFTEEVKNDGPRVASMFKSIKPEFHQDNTITLHMSNVDQSDLFVRNYKLRLISFLEKKYNCRGLVIEARVDTADTGGVIYSDEQKYSYLSGKYPSLKDIRKTFNLDFE